MTSWLSLNFHAFSSTLRKLIEAPFSSFFSVSVIGIALSLPAGIYVLISNFDSASRQISASPQISLFLAKSASPDDIAGIGRRLNQNPLVEKFKFVSKEEAMRDLRKHSDFSDVAAELKENPLPDAYIVTAKENENLESLWSEAKRWPKVEHAELDSSWVKKLNSILKLGHIATIILSAIFGAALIFITFNTIRLQILTQREEIEVTKLIGATHTFIRRPFLYQGALQGMLGGLAAWGIIAAGLYFANGAIAELAALYGSSFALSNLNMPEVLILLAVSSILGWLGAWLSSSRHLWALDSE